MLAALASTLALAWLQWPEVGFADEGVDPVRSQVADTLQRAAAESADSTDSTDSTDAASSAERLIANGTCPCGCGNSLPGSGRATACFGCSVGKAEVTFIRESLAAGRPLGEILIALRELVLVEVFADYTDPGLPAVWQRARRAAEELGQHRVVLRAPALDELALRTLAVAECARGSGAFSRVQRALIEYDGPWDNANAARVALGVLQSAAADSARSGADGWTLESLVHCADSRDLSLQIERDRRHARERAMESFPAVSVNRERIPDTLVSLRRAIRLALQKGSI